MDGLFGRDQDLQLQLQMEPDLPFMDDNKIMNEISMDLDDFNFDFDCMSDNNLGPWIQPDHLKIDTSANLSNDLSDDVHSDSIIPDDLDITEAVRYDCMWSSNPCSPSLQYDQTTPPPALVPALCQNSLFEEFLRMVDAPSHIDLGIDIKSEHTDDDDDKDPLRQTEAEDEEALLLLDREKQARLFTSLDHCYVSSSSSPAAASAKPTFSSTSFPVTPPESSEDEDAGPSSPFPHVINPAPSTCVRSSSSASLLKTSRCKVGGGQPKFCFRVKLKSDKSRSLLKQKSSSSGLSGQAVPVKKSLGIMNRNTVQTSIRRRKEDNLQLKHHEAREIHNHMERQRRNELKIAYDTLKACIPDIADSEKVSKQMILDTALEKCKLFKSREISLRMRKEKLKRSNAELRQRLKNLQKMQNV